MAELQRLDTVIDSVTVFNRSALVSRTGKLPDLTGETSASFRITGLPLSVDPSSIRVVVVDRSGWKESDGSSQQISKRIKLALRSGWAVRHVMMEIDRMDSLDATDDEELSLAITALEKERDEVTFSLSGISAQMGEVIRWMASPVEAPEDEEFRPQFFPYAAWEAFIRTCSTRLEELQRSERELHRRYAALAQELQVKLELQSGKRQRAPGEADYFKNLTVSLACVGESSHQPDLLEISYVVPGAQWKPVYKLYISDDFRKAKLVMGAQVAQRSGEEWPEVSLRFSAASFRRITQLPELPSRRIGRVQPPRPGSYREKLPPPESLFSAYDSWQRSQKSISPTVPVTLKSLFEQCEKKLGELLADTDSAEARTKSARALMSELLPLPEIFPPAAPPPPEPPPAIVVCEQQIVTGKSGRGYSTGALEDNIEMDFMKAPLMEYPKAEASQPSLKSAEPVRFRSEEKQKKMAAPAKTNLESRLKKGLDYLKESTVIHRIAPGAERFAEADEQLAGDFCSFPSADDFDGSSSLMDCSVREGGTEAHKVPDYFSYELGDPEKQKQFRGQLIKKRNILFSPRISEPESDVLERIEKVVRSAEVNLVSDSELPQFQCVYEAECRAHIPGDGHPHTVNIMVGLSESEMHFRTVPMTDSKVFRRLSLRNPFPFPLPGGEVQAFLENAYLLTTPFKGAGSDGELIFPLGAEPRLRVARNTAFTQDEKGIVGENSLASHTVSIQVRSHLPLPVTLEILERIPIKEESEKKIDIKVTSCEPRSEQIEFMDDMRVRGTHRWFLDVKPGEEISACLEYRISIPSKMEIVGGNRRL